MVIGILAGLFACVFAYSLARAEQFTFSFLANLPLSAPPGELHFNHAQGESNKLILFFLPIFGGILTGLVVYLFCPDAEGTGTDAMIQAFHYKEGKMDTRVPFFKAIATIITLASGGSAGKEGPTAQIGAGVGVVLSKLVNAGARARRTFLLAGTAGGLGAIFRAPLGGAITAVEVIYQEDFESDSLVPCIISSVTAYLVFTSIFGPGSMFKVHDIGLKDYHELFFYVILGLVCFAMGFVFVSVFNYIGAIFKKINIHPVLKPGIGGLIVGSFGYFFPELIGGGFGLLQKTISGEGLMTISDSRIYVASFFLLIAFLKILTTSFTIGSGGSGGVFGPSILIGGMLGGFVGVLSSTLFPQYNFSLSSFILVGMSAFFVGVARAPIAGMIMVCDMVGNYNLLPPLMIVSVISFILSHRRSIYKGQVENRFKSPAHEWDMNQDAMERIHISKYFSDFKKYAIITKDKLLTEVEDLALEIQESDFIIVNPDGSYFGSASLRRNRLEEENRDFLRNLITIEDVATSLPCVTTKNTLGDALKIILNHDIDKVAVLRQNKVIGYLRYNDILKAYHTELSKYSRKSI